MDPHLEKMLQKLKKKMLNEDCDKKPCKTNLSFFAGNLRGKVLKMSATTLSTELVPTIIIGTISQVYDENMWDKDMIEVGSHFNIDVTNDVANVFQIKMEPVPEDPTKMDSAKAIKLMERAVYHINTGNRVRIVRVGISSTEFFFEAMSYLLQQWTSADKVVQFVTAGDTQGSKMLNFCKSLCLSGKCKEIEFYDTQDYHPFGFYKSEWHRPY